MISEREHRLAYLIDMEGYTSHSNAKIHWTTLLQNTKKILCRNHFEDGRQKYKQSATVVESFEDIGIFLIGNKYIYIQIYNVYLYKTTAYIMGNLIECVV